MSSDDEPLPFPRPGWRMFVFVWAGAFIGGADGSVLSFVLGGALTVGVVGAAATWLAAMWTMLTRKRKKP